MTRKGVSVAELSSRCCRETSEILTRGLRRNDAQVVKEYFFELRGYFLRLLYLDSLEILALVSFQSLIVRDRCKLELWDHADDLDLGLPADLVIPLHHWNNFFRTLF